MTVIDVLNNNFDKIYVLTIERLKERHALIAKNLAGLNYQLFFGVDKQTITLQQFATEDIYNNNAYTAINNDAPKMGLGALCCALGHVHIYKHMVANNIKTALILEDDVVLNAINLNDVTGVFAHLPANWELLYLGYNRNETNGWLQKIKTILYQLKPPHTRLNIKKQQFKKYYPSFITNNIWHSGYHDCTHAYALTLQAAQKLLVMQTPICYKSDTLLSFAVTLNVLKGFIAKPKIFNQLSTQVNSSVQSEIG